jgi:hypothetical protein
MFFEMIKKIVNSLRSMICRILTSTQRGGGAGS